MTAHPGSSPDLASSQSAVAAPSSNSRQALRAALENIQPVHRASIGTLLTKAGVVTQADVRDALEEQKKHPEQRLGDVLVASGKVGNDRLYAGLAEQMGVPYVRLGEFDVEPAALAALPADIARARRVLPLMLHDGRLVLATDDPADGDALSALRFRAQRPIEAVLASPEDLDTAIAKHCPLFDDAKLLEEARDVVVRVVADPASPQEMAVQKPIIRLVNNILQNAVQRGASDIHVHPRETKAEVRYRIDGSLVPVGEISAVLIPAIVARVKVLASMDVAEHRLPQDGAIHMDTAHGPVDMRVSVMPAVFGENVVIRILDRSIGLRRLSDVGFTACDERRMRALLARNQGLVLVTGPTGSGKTTTLYAALSELNNGEYQIITVEDPVEFRIDGLVQIRARADIDYGFPTALRHILRHDPDVIFIGEIRDAETAKIAIESALTGHLVLSTLHTNSAVQTITRLVEIGIPPYLVTATLAGVLAQRLARRSCASCKVPEAVSPETREQLGVGPDEPFWRGKGCERCGGTGYKGRIATYELLEMSPALRALVHRGATIDELETQAVRDGMVKLVSQALALARAGTISLDEVLRVRLD